MLKNLICVPFRLLDPFPIRESLVSIIKKDYFQPASTFNEDLNRLQDLQNYVSSVASQTDVDLDAFENALYDYYYMIQDVASKFPDKVVTITWYGTLGYKPKSSPASSWKEVQGNTIYQLASVYCQKAIRQSPFSDDGIKAACSYFKLAAGTFEHLRSLNLQLVDFDDATLLSLQWLMLAQAQELTWNKAISNPSMKNTVIGRLSIKVAEFYATAREYADRSDLIVLDWINHFKVKEYHFKAAAEYRVSMTAQDSFEYGRQVAYLKVASDHCAEAAKYKRYVDAAVVEDLQGLTTVVNDSLRSAEKDNDLVYLKAVPPASELPPINGVSMVNAEIPSKLTTRDNTTSAFASLLPFHIIQVAQAFKERQEQFIVQSFHEPLQALTRMLAKFLADRDLPASIDTLQKPENLPESIVHHAQEIMSIGGIALIETSMGEISKLAAQSQELVGACEERLRMEKYEDDLMRERQGTARWSRPPSEVAGAEFLARTQKMKLYLEQGHQSDILIGDNFTAIKSFLEIYCGGRDALVRSIPTSSHSTIGLSIAKLISELRDLLKEVDNLEKSRQRHLLSIEIKSRDHSILPAILSEFKKNPSSFQNSEGTIEPSKFEVIYEKHLRSYSADFEFVERSKQQQVALEKKIDQTNAEFAQARNISFDSSQRKRLEMLQSFEEAYVQYLELVSNLNQASKFYVDFLEKGNVVLRELDNFLYLRREEARELEISIHNANNLQNIEQSMSQSKESLPAPRGQKANTWDPSKGIRFS